MVLLASFGFSFVFVCYRLISFLQEDFDEFSDVDELYISLPLDKVEALEELVIMGPPGLVKVNISPICNLEC